MSVNSDQLEVNSEDDPRSSVFSPQADKSEPQGKSEAVKTPSPLRGTPPLQGESHEVQKLEDLATFKTRGVRVAKSVGADVLHPAVERAARSGWRNDVHEYMRIRRNYV